MSVQIYIELIILQDFETKEQKYKQGNKNVLMNKISAINQDCHIIMRKIE